MAKEYIEHHDGGYYVAGTEVSLDSVVYAFLRGESPERIADSFPALSVEQGYGAVAVYLSDRREPSPGYTSWGSHRRAWWPAPHGCTLPGFIAARATT
jgi:uncharacterized protein (DUF433 family)